MEERAGRPGFIRRIWRTRSVALPSFISVAVPTWQIVFVQSHDGSQSIVARGPETLATRSGIPKDAIIFGIQFELGAFHPNYPMGNLVDNAESLPVDSDRTFWLNGSRFEIPTFENAEVFVDRLVRSGGLVQDPVVEQTLQCRPISLSDRSIQRRFIRATGLTYAALRQMERAERAARLLRGGTPILDVVDSLEYSDQSHLTRSLKRFLGMTPARISKATV
ncbi:MAG: helix-turn-helix transcriptional regulator [Proteobacteria bacterium]|nr:helix-turn-helix transcriptional regulator [Pseudomonadota bacterium]